MHWVKVCLKIFWNIPAVVFMGVGKLCCLLLFLPFQFLSWLVKVLSGVLTVLGLILGTISFILYAFCHIAGIFADMPDGYNILFHIMWIVVSLVVIAVPFWLTCLGYDYFDEIAEFPLFVLSLPIDVLTISLANGFCFKYSSKRQFYKNTSNGNNDYEENRYGNSDGTNEESINWFKGIKDFETLKKRYRDLLKIYHPDNNAGDTVITQQIQKEYEKILLENNWI